MSFATHRTLNCRVRRYSNSNHRFLSSRIGNASSRKILVLSDYKRLQLGSWTYLAVVYWVQKIVQQTSASNLPSPKQIEETRSTCRYRTYRLLRLKLENQVPKLFYTSWYLLRFNFQTLTILRDKKMFPIKLKGMTMILKRCCHSENSTLRNWQNIWASFGFVKLQHLFSGIRSLSTVNDRLSPALE